MPRRGDELELAEYVLSAWNQVDISDTMHLQALTLLVVGFLPTLVLTEVAGASDDVAYLGTFDQEAVQTFLERSGVLAWCQERGHPLPLSRRPRNREASTEPISPADALAVVRDLKPKPTPTDELDAHAVLDTAVRDALPLCQEVLEWVAADQELSDIDRMKWRNASLKLLATCSLTAGIILPAIAWSDPDQGGLEQWLGFAFLATYVALNLRLLAEASSSAERNALLFFEADDLFELAERL